MSIELAFCLLLYSVKDLNGKGLPEDNPQNTFNLFVGMLFRSQVLFQHSSMRTETVSSCIAGQFDFLCVTDCAKNSVVLQEGETEAYRWVSKDELLSMKHDELVTERMQCFIDELMTSDG